MLGATGNVYTVNLSVSPSCTCPDRIIPCKHILFVLIRVLGASLEDERLRRRTLRPRQLNRLLSNPTSPESLAGASVRERFHQLFFQMEEIRRRRREGGGILARVEIEEGSICPVCLDELTAAEKVVACGTCRNPIHDECWLMWKRSRRRRRRRSATCVICRARWRSRGDQEGGSYLNLSAYVSEDDMAEGSSTTVNLCVD